MWHAWTSFRVWRLRWVLVPLLALAVVAGVLSDPRVAQAAPSAGASKVTQDPDKAVFAAQAAGAQVMGTQAAAAADQTGAIPPVLTGADAQAMAQGQVPAPPVNIPGSLPADKLPPTTTPADQADLDRTRATDAALAQAKATGKQVEIASQTTDTSISYAQPDGKVRVQTSAAPVRTKVNGAWVDVNTTLQLTPAGIQPVAVPGSVTFSAGGNKPMALLGNHVDANRDGKDDTSLTLQWPTALPAPTLQGATATYANVLPGVDLQLTATRSGFQQHLVVNSPPDAATLAKLGALKFPVTTAGAALTKATDGQLKVTDKASGKQLLGSAAPPVMWDARTNPASGDPAATTPIGIDLTAPTVAGTDSTLVLSPAMSFFTDPATVYPVVIDPNQTLGAIGDTFVQNNIANTPQGGSTELRVGTYNGGGQVDRSLLRFDTSGIKNRLIDHADLWMFENYSSSCTPTYVDVHDAADFDPNNATWGNQPGIGDLVANANTAHGYSSACPADWVLFDMTGLTDAYSDSSTGRGTVMPLEVNAWQENDSLSWKKFNSSEVGGSTVPALWVTVDPTCDQYGGYQVCGAIRDKYYASGGAGGPLGMPLTDETELAGGAFNHFQGGSIYWSPATGAHIIKGAIRDKWAALGWETSFLGYPTSDENTLPGGAFNDFQGQNGSIYWSGPTGAWSVQGTIKAWWGSLGWENSYLGYPTSDEVAITGGRRTTFANGFIDWSAKTNSAIDASNGVPMTQPVANQRSGRRVPIAVSIDPAWTAKRSKPVLQYRRGPADTWKPINLGTVADKNGTPVCTGDCSTASLPTTTNSDGRMVINTTGNVVYWDAGLQLAGVGGVLDVRAAYTTDTNTTVPGAPAPGVTYDPNSGQSGTMDVGAGTANLLTGELTLSATDASAFGISITRSYGSRSTDAGTRDTAAGAFGPQWRMGGVAETTDTDYTQVKKTSDTSIDVVETDGSTVSFTLNNTGGWTPEPGAESFTLAGPTAVTGTVSTYTLTESTGGTITTFTQDTSVAGASTVAWPVSDSTLATPAAVGARTRYLYQTDAAGKLRLLRVAAPNPALPDATAAQCVTASVPLTALPAGCRVLAPVWTTVTTGAGSVPRVSEIDLYATDPAAPTAAPTATVLATYTYNAAGYLTAVADPRPGITGGTGASYPGQTPIGVTYAYAADTTYANAKTLDPKTGQVTTASVTRPGRITTVTPTGRQPWTLGYAAAGPAFEAGQPGSDGKIITVARPTLAAGSTSTTAGTATTNVVYGVPLTKAAGGAQDMAYSSTRWWNQDVPPTDATAVFRTDAPAAANTGDHWASDDTTTRNWASASVGYLDVNGRTVDTSTPVTGSTPAIDVTQYDLAGNPTFTLTAADRATTMGQDDPATVAAGGQTASQIWSALALPTTAVPADLTAAPDGDPSLGSVRFRASSLGTLTTYEVGPVSKDERATLIQAPLHLAMTGSGPAGPAGTAAVRSVTVTAYDENRPATAAASIADLATTVTEATLPGTAYDPASLVDRNTTTTAYDWNHGVPLTVVTDPGGLAITHTKTYDSLGRVTADVMPADTGAGTAAGTAITAYYGPGAAGVCGSAAAATVWGGMVCTTGPAGTITGATAGSATTLPTTVSTYSRTGATTVATETSGTGTTAMVRTTTTSYDAADRPRQVTITGTGPGWTTSTPAGTTMTRTTTYNATGDTTAVTDPAANTSITTTTDTLGRVISTTDATGLTTTTAYDNLNRPTTSTQAGTISGAARTYTTTNAYDAVTGQLTSGNDTIAGGSTATYSLDGAVVRQTWTAATGGALSATTLTDTAGSPTAKTWRQGTTVVLSNTNASDGHGRIVTDTQTMPTLATTVAGSNRARRYGYDNTGRLTTTADTRQAPGTGGSTTAATQCVIRAWAFNANSNRTGEASSAPTSSACAATGYTPPATTGTGAVTHSYNGADQITDNTGGIPTSYDSFGRTTQLSGSTAGAPGTAKLTTVGYTVTDMAAAQTLYTGNTTASGVESTQTWAVDPTGTRFSSTAITTGGTTKTTTYRYDDAGDSPALITEADGTTTRPVTDLSGEMTATTAISATGTTAVTWQLTNLHGDVAATLPNTAGAAPAPCASVDEYGKPLDPLGAAPVAGSTPAARYNWLGGHQRSDENITGLTLMGARLYNPTTGRFLSIDPVPGGSANNYDYSNADPIDQTDLDGRLPRWARHAWGGVSSAARAVGRAGASVGRGVGRGARAVAGFASRHWRGAAQAALIGAGLFAGAMCVAATAGICGGVIAGYVIAGGIGGVAGAASYSIGGGRHTRGGYASAFGVGAAGNLAQGYFARVALRAAASLRFQGSAMGIVRRLFSNSSHWRP